MTYLEGDSGPEIEGLQHELLAAGCDPHGLDGDFGPATTAAVRVFQSRRGLAVDGIAGPATLAALGVLTAPLPAAVAGKLVDVTDHVTVAMVVPMFPGTVTANIRANLPRVLAALAKVGLGDRDMILAGLGTVRAEVASFLPESEGQSRFNTASAPFDLYDHRGDLGNRGVPDGASFRGRGFVQLTGRANYTTYSARLGMGTALVTDPIKACDPIIAASILALFLKDCEPAMRRALAANDLKTARRLVNGGSHGLPDFSAAFNAGLKTIPAG